MKGRRRQKNENEGRRAVGDSVKSINCNDRVITRVWILLEMEIIMPKIRCTHAQKHTKTVGV